MPRYFFDISDHVFIKDEIGSEAAGLASIRSKAIKVATAAVAAEAATGGNPDAIQVLVRDVADRRVLTVRAVSPDHRS